MNYKGEAQQIQSSCSKWSRKRGGVMLQNEPLNRPRLVTIFPPLITDSDDQNRELLSVVWNSWCLKDEPFLTGNLHLSLNSCDKMYVQTYTKILVTTRNEMTKVEEVGHSFHAFLICMHFGTLTNGTWIWFSNYDTDYDNYHFFLLGIFDTKNRGFGGKICQITLYHRAYHC